MLSIIFLGSSIMYCSKERRSEVLLLDCFCGFDVIVIRCFGQLPEINKVSFIVFEHILYDDDLQRQHTSVESLSQTFRETPYQFYGHDNSHP